MNKKFWLKFYALVSSAILADFKVELFHSQKTVITVRLNALYISDSSREDTAKDTNKDTI